MPVGGACLEACGVARAQRFLAGICYQNDLPADDVYELVAYDLPVSLAGPGSGRQAEEVDAELAQTRGVAEALPLAVATGGIEWRRVIAAARDVDDSKVEFSVHRISSPFAQTAR